MSENVKGPRPYNSARRRAQAAQTRQDILNAAREQFLRRGFGGATLAGIAAAAGVVVETIYRSFEGKGGLFRAVVEDAVADGTLAGAAAPRDSARLRAEFDAIIAETDPRRQLQMYADTQRGIQARIGPLMRLLAEASAADPAVRKTSEHLEAQHLDGMDRFARLLAGRNALRPGLSIEEARDVLWTLNSHAVYDLLVIHRGWAPERYRDWLADTLARLLLHEVSEP